jgi:hypothetical protein
MIEHDTIARTMADRLTAWGLRLQEHCCTPVLLLGVGRGEHRGEVVVLTLEELDNDLVLDLLTLTMLELKRQKRPEG